MFIQTKLLGLAGVMMAVMTLGFYWYYQNSQKRLAQAAQEIATQQIAIEQQRIVLDQLRADMNQQIQLRQQHDTNIKKTQQDVERMRQQFQPRLNPQTGETQTVARRAQIQPTEVTVNINNRTREQLRCFELLTGAALKEDEINGKTSNSLCQDLLDRRVGAVRQRRP